MILSSMSNLYTYSNGTLLMHFSTSRVLSDAIQAQIDMERAEKKRNRHITYQESSSPARIQRPGHQTMDHILEDLDAKVSRKKAAHDALITHLVSIAPVDSTDPSDIDYKIDTMMAYCTDVRGYVKNVHPLLQKLERASLNSAPTQSLSVFRLSERIDHVNNSLDELEVDILTRKSSLPPSKDVEHPVHASQHDLELTHEPQVAADMVIPHSQEIELMNSRLNEVCSRIALATNRSAHINYARLWTAWHS